VKFSNVIVRMIAVFLAVSVVQMLAGMLAALLIPVKTPLPPNLMQHFLQWMFLTNSVTIVALTPLAVRCEWRGWKLGAAVAAIPTGIVLINGIEGVIFLKNSHIEWPRIFLTTIIAALLSVPVWMLLFGRRTDRPTEHFHPIATKPRWERAWKFAVCDISYIALYLIAGTIILPYIKDFYATQTVPSMPAIFGLQLLVRGPAFIVLCVLLVRMLGLPRLSGALTVGLLFTLLSGVAPLLMPNPYFPDSVRWMHFVEVTSSNFVFGALVGMLWGQPRTTQSRVLAHAA
jgi:hypothetical protein